MAAARSACRRVGDAVAGRSCRRRRVDDRRPIATRVVVDAPRRASSATDRERRAAVSGASVARDAIGGRDVEPTSRLRIEADEVRRARARRLRRRAARRARRPHAARGRGACRAWRALAARGEVGRAGGDPARACRRAATSATWRSSGSTRPRYHTGRAPIEAAAMGVELGPDEVAYRCNLVTVDDEPPTMVDFAAGHLTSEQSHPIVAALDAALGGGRDGVRFHPGVEYRHLCVVPARLGRRRLHAAARPHRQAGGVADRARGARSSSRSMDASQPVVARRRGRGRLDRDADLAVGPGRPARAAAFDATVRRRRPAVVGGRPRARARRAHRASRSSTCRARPPGSTTTTPRKRDAASRRSTTATSSCCTSRPPTRPATRARVDEKVDALERWDARRSSARSSTRSTGAGAVPDPAAARPRDAVRAQDAHVRPGAVPAVRLDASTAAGGVYTERGVADCRRRSPRTSSWRRLLDVTG